jgi:hypothetical protein
MRRWAIPVLDVDHLAGDALMKLLKLNRTREDVRFSDSYRARSGIVCILGASIIISCGARRTEANMIYSLISFPTLQNGYSLTGTITTDGRLGTLAFSDIVATSITSVTNGVSTYQNLQPNHVYGETSLFATSTGLFLPAATPGPPSPNLAIGSLGYDVVDLQYDYAASSGVGYVDFFGSVNHPTTLTQLWTTSGSDLLNLTGQPWQIAQATVPEPSARLLLGAGAATLLGMRRLRGAKIRRQFRESLTLRKPRLLC